MSELDEGLQRLLSDDEGLKSLLSAASGLMSKPADPPAENTEPAARTSAFASPDLLSMLGGFLGGAAPSGGATSGQSPLTSALPGLLQGVTGKANYIKEDRLNLIRAMKPYMAESRAGSIDRAIKMANMAKAAKTAMGFMGR